MGLPPLHEATHRSGGVDAIAAALAAASHPAYAEAIISRHHYLLGTVGLAGNYFFGMGFTEALVPNWSPVGANTLIMQGCWVPRPFTPDLLGINIAGGAAAGREVRIGFYGSLANGRPGSLIFDGGAVSAATTGIKTVAYNTQIPAGLYWLALNCNDANISIYYFTQMLWILGLGSGGSQPIHKYQVAQTYGPLPNPAPTTLMDSSNPHWLGFRIASVP